MTPPPPRHTLADHKLGSLAGHEHEGDEDHDHDDDPRHDLLNSDSRALEAAPFVSIGIDVGSAGTQVVFSRLTMRGPGEPVSLRRLVKSRQTLWASPISFTPWDQGRIDVEALRTIVDAAFTAAGIHPDDVETGAVILTGDAASSANARAILDALAEETGELVCAVAGHHMEAMLAARGSGAVRRSFEMRARILLIDIGGGTTKLALVDDGRVDAVAALRLGGRLAAFDADGRILRLSEDFALLMRQEGLNWSLGARASREDIMQAGAIMAAMLLRAATAPRAPGSPGLSPLWLTEPMREASGLDGVMFSGGVAEYVYGRETREFDDLGLAFGRALRDLIDAGALPFPALPPGECIRATALGASEYSLQISGETSFISAPGRLLPRRNLQVVAPDYAFASSVDAVALALAIRKRRRLFDLAGSDREFALALRWRGDPDHARLRACAEGVVDGLADLVKANQPLFILMEGDAALNLAAILREELNVGNDVLALDGIVLRDFDWVDIGRLRLPSNTVPVTVKTLMFEIDQTQR